MLDGRHVMTYGHVPAAVLDACMTAFSKGWIQSEDTFKPEGL